jgi:hypothetical protein
LFANQGKRPHCCESRLMVLAIGVVFLETKPAHCEAKKGWWTLGSRTGQSMSLDSRCGGFARRS